MKNRVIVAEQDQRDKRFLAQLRDHREYRRQRRPRLQSARTRALIRRPVRHRVGKWYTQFDDIGAARLEFEHQPRGRFDAGVARHDKRDQRRFIACAQLPEFLRDSALRHRSFPAHRLTPSACATVCISLSPRPERLTTITCSRGIVGASFAAYATACALSSAGIMPSVSESSLSPSSASASVTATYCARPVSLSHACSGPTPG